MEARHSAALKSSSMAERWFVNIAAQNCDPPICRPDHLFQPKKRGLSSSSGMNRLACR